MSSGREMLTWTFYVPLLFNVARIALILVFAYIGTLVTGRLLRGLRRYVIRMMLKAGGGSQYEIEKRVETVSGVLRKALFLLVWSMAGIMILREMNFDIGRLMAGAGVTGLELGLEARRI